MSSLSSPRHERRAEPRASIPAAEILLEEARGRRLAVVRELCRSGMGTEVLMEAEAGHGYFEAGRSYSLFLVAENDEARFPVHATVVRLDGIKIAFSLRRDAKTRTHLEKLLLKYCPGRSQIQDLDTSSSR